MGYQIKDVSERSHIGNFGFKSYMLTKPWVEYSDEEIIALSNYSYVTRQSDNLEIIPLLNSNPLVLLLHMADISSSHLT